MLVFITYTSLEIFCAYNNEYPYPYPSLISFSINLLYTILTCSELEHVFYYSCCSIALQLFARLINDFCNQQFFKASQTVFSIHCKIQKRLVYLLANYINFKQYMDALKLLKSCRFL